MPASRVPFALYDMRAEIRRLDPHRPGAMVEVRLDAVTFEQVKSELLHHHGSDRLKEARSLPPNFEGFVYAGIRVLRVPPGQEVTS
jgi:hypothetical protein